MFTYIISSSCVFKKDIKRQVHISMSEIKFDDDEALVNPSEKQHNKGNPSKKRHNEGRSCCALLIILVSTSIFLLIFIVIIIQVWFAWL